MFDETSLHDEIDADANYFNQVYPSLHEDRTNQYCNSKSYNIITSQYDDTKFSPFHLIIILIRGNGDTLTCYLQTLNQKLDIICLTATWMMDLEPLNNVLQDYAQYCSVRLNRRNIGVAFYVKKTYTCSILQTYN